jgi:3-hydroxyacyl-CoA dehydrogenase
MSYAINRVVVIGAGAMGAAIAAHLANVGIPSTLLDIAPRELTRDEAEKGLTLASREVRNRIVNEGWQRCVKARPANLFTADAADRVTLGNLEDDFACVAQADWVVEAVVERLDIKQQLMARIDAIRKPGSIISTNTSGIPIKDIATGRSADFQAHFLGTHFFNPPRYLKLLEIIPHAGTSPDVVIFMAAFGGRTLGKGVVICKDTPNFIANRFISLAGTYTLNYALAHGYSIADVDALTGPLIGHPKTATFRLYDLVGVDIMDHVNTNLYPLIPQDPYREVLKDERSLALIREMVGRKWLGNKAQQGFYKQVQTEKGRQFWTLDPATMEYSLPTETAFDSVKKYGDVEDTGERIKALCAEAWAGGDRAAQFVWATIAFSVNYCASVVPEIADDILSIDNAMKWGFGHELGPFEIWDALGVAESARQMEATGMTVTSWVAEMLATGHPTFYRRTAGRLEYYDPASKGYVAAPADSRAIVLRNVKADGRRVVADNPSASLVDLGDGVLGLEFHSKANALDVGVFEMLGRAGEELERDWVGMVIGNQGANFCAGANLNLFVEYAQNREWARMDALIAENQQRLLVFRYSPKPVVSAPFGVVLGGGAEVMMAASAICAGAESYIGQVEAGVGVVPALGGCKELLRRVISPVARGTPAVDVMPYVQKVFEMVAMAKVSGSAEDARQMGFLTPTDRVIANPDHLLYEAKRTVQVMAELGYRPPVRGKEIWAVGANGLAMLQTMVYAMKEAGYISEHDALIADKSATILSGGRLTRPQWVDVDYILDLEREAFLSLLGTQKTLDRVVHMLKTGKALRN